MNVFLANLVILVFQLVVCTAQSCDTVPVSLSQLNYCTDENCYFTESAVIDLSLPTTRDSCLQFISPDPSVPPFTVYLSIISSYFNYPVVNCYFTDIIKTDIDGFCHCPGSLSTADCDSCSASVTYNQSVLCSQALHSDKSCIEDWFGGEGSYCYKLGLAAANRYKVCQYKGQAILQTDLQVTYDDRSFHIPFSGVITENYDLHDNINVTVLSQTTQSYDSIDFTVLDTYHPSSFYIFPSSFVNEYRGSDVQKFGFYQPNNNPPTQASMEELVHVKLDSCLHDRFKWNLRFVNSDEFLKDRSTYLAHTNFPNAILLDSNFNTTTTKSFIHDVPTIEGFSFEDDFGIKRIGITEDGTIFPDVCFTTPSTIINTTKGDYEGLNLTVNFCPIITTVDSVDYLLGYGTHDGGYTLCSRRLINNPPQLVFCTDTFSGFEFHFPNIKLLPSLRKGRPYMADTTSFYFDHTPDFEQELWIPPPPGSLQLRIDFRNLNVSFQSTTIKPSLMSFNYNSTIVTVKAKSLTVAGTCYISTTTPFMFTVQPIFLTLQSVTYYFDNEAAFVNGTISVIINCHNSNSTLTKFVSYNNTISDNAPSSGIFESASDSFNPRNLSDLISGFFDFDLPWHGWLSSIFYIIMLILLIGIIVFGIYIFSKFVLSYISFSFFNRNKPL